MRLINVRSLISRFFYFRESFGERQWKDKHLVLLDLLLLRSQGAMILGQVVGKLLVGRLGENGLLPEVWRQVGIGLRNSSIGRLSCKMK